MAKQAYHDIEDKDLLSKFYQDHDNEWLGILLQRYTLLLFGVCMKYLKDEEEAKDCVQQVFLKVIAELHKYEVQYFKTWLYMVTKNQCLMKLRSKGKKTVELTDYNVRTTDDEELLSNSKQKDVALDNMEVALSTLNHEQQQCIKLFYLEKKTYQEIAESTGYSILQVKSNIQNGKRNLKIQMERMQKDV